MAKARKSTKGSVKTKSKTRKKTANKTTRKKKPARKAKASQEWPASRQVLFRPDRYSYVRKIDRPLGCVFCSAAEKGVGFESLCVYQSEHSMIVLNKYPYNSGHVLVLPKQHIAKITDLSADQYTDLMDTLKKAVAAVEAVYAPVGLNLGLNQGAVAGAGIPDHLHFHAIPRWAGDLNFFPLVAETKVVVESLESSFDRLVTYLK